MNISLYNTMTRRVEPFEPMAPGKVGLYCCGPTVYNFAHIGNMRTYIFEDILSRMFAMAGYDVTHVMNVTDVGHLTSDADEGEDKMLVAMRREGKTAHDIAGFYADAFFRHAGALNIRRPTVTCKATEHVADMIALVRRLEERGLAYVAGGNVYFDITAFSAYGKLGGQRREDLQAGARIEVDAAKRNPHDFALWFTKSKFENQEMIWDSPWGRGYPGWHIECSAMSMKYLGEQFDIHCGGVDHIAVHHTNEIAQSEGATGKAPWVRVWMHAEFLVTYSERMSKSSGEFTTVDTLIAKGYDPLAYRYLCLGAAYRQQLGFSYEALDGAANALDRLRRSVLALKEEAGGKVAPVAPDHPRLVEFLTHLADDLNMPRALSVVWGVLKDDRPAAEKLGLLYKFDEVMALGLESYRPAAQEIPAEVTALAERRAQVRKAKDWKESDRLRDEIAALGYIVKDTPEGPDLTKKG
jgi:cysteinyl-tRNA synthetase